MSKSHKVSLTLLVLWIALIFGTSCTVIHFAEFVRFIHGLGGGVRFNAWFANFWLVSWFVIVKGWHATEHGILTCLSVAVLRRVTQWNLRQCVVAALAFTVLFAISDEWHQTFVPGRDGCVRDVFIDSAGALVAAVAILSNGARRQFVRHAKSI